MKKQDRRHTRRGLRAKAVAIAAGTLALTLGATVSASANGTATVTSGTAVSHGRTAFSSNAAEPVFAFGIDGRDSAGTIWDYPPAANGGFGARDQSGHGFSSATALFKNNPGAGTTVYMYARVAGDLYIFDTEDGRRIGGGWNIYNAFVTPGNVGGAVNPDMLARDSSGVLWEYLSYSTGNFAPRTRVGGGWNIYSQIAGRGDLTGDGKSDIVAQDKSGVLWLYKGTGNYKAPFAPRTRIGGGWNTYNRIIGLGDSSGDARNDLVARDKAGALWLYKGTGSASAPYAPRVKIGTGGWNAFNYLF